MVTPRRSAAVLLALLIFVAWFAWFRPATLGGPATYIIISGESMEPTYQDGDLVILRRASSYQAGDIVAYPMETYFDSGRLVIHRITGADEDGFITRGDNRDAIDPWRPAPASIRGKAWLHVPGAGSFLTWLREPSRIGALAAGIFLLGGLRTTHTYRRRRRHMIPRLATQRGRPSARGTFGAFPAGLAMVFVIAGVALLAFVLLGLFAFRTPARATSQVSQPAYTESGAFDYAIVMEPSTLYSDGILRPPEADAAPAADEDTPPSPPPAFTALAKEARLVFRYEITAQEPVVLDGTAAADLVIHPAGGEWSRTAALLAPTPFRGNALTRPLTIDLVEVGALIARIEAETGLSASAYAVEVVARVEASGTRAGEPIETAFESTFTLDYDRTLIRPPATLATTKQSTSTEDITTPESLSLALWSPSVSSARAFSAAGFAAALGALLISGAYLVLALWTDEQARIRARYGSRLVDVQAAETPANARAVRVASMNDLARLAERSSGVILHQPLPAGHRYFVRDGEDTYEYLSGAAGGAGPGSATTGVTGAPGPWGG